MEIYADYEYYNKTYKGLLDSSSFENFAVQASLKIKNLTSNRATSDIEEVKQCMCKLADAIYENSKIKTNISSEKVDNYSRNYVIKNETDKSKEYYLIVEEYLGRLGLLYGGVLVVY